MGVNAELSFVKAYVVPPLKVRLSNLDILSTCSNPRPKYELIILSSPIVLAINPSTIHSAK